MPLLKPTEKTEKINLRIIIEKKVADEMKAYCDWAAIKKIDDFVAQAIQFVFDKDKDWKTEWNKTVHK